MKFFEVKLIIIASIALALGGCASSMIDVRKGSDLVALADASKVANCTSKGNVTVSVLAEVGFISRSSEAVEENLLQLARNGAIDTGGDTIVKGESLAYGKRTFGIYKCQP